MKILRLMSSLLVAILPWIGPTPITLVSLALASTFSHAAASTTATYKFVGKKFTMVSGCLMKTDRLSMTLIVSKPIAPNSCFDGVLKSIEISDGVNSARSGSGYFTGSTVLLCKSGKNIGEWLVYGTLISKSGAVKFFPFVAGPTSVYDQVTDYTGKCANGGAGSTGSTGAAGKWTGP